MYLLYTRQDNEQASLDANLTNSRCYLSQTDREKQENLEYIYPITQAGFTEIKLKMQASMVGT